MDVAAAGRGVPLRDAAQIQEVVWEQAEDEVHDGADQPLAPAGQGGVRVGRFQLAARRLVGVGGSLGLHAVAPYHATLPPDRQGAAGSAGAGPDLRAPPPPRRRRQRSVHRCRARARRGRGPHPRGRAPRRSARPDLGGGGARSRENKPHFRIAHDVGAADRSCCRRGAAVSRAARRYDGTRAPGPRHRGRAADVPALTPVRAREAPACRDGAARSPGERPRRRRAGRSSRARHGRVRAR